MNKCPHGPVAFCDVAEYPVEATLVNPEFACPAQVGNPAKCQGGQSLDQKSADLSARCVARCLEQRATHRLANRGETSFQATTARTNA